MHTFLRISILLVFLCSQGMGADIHVAPDGKIATPQAALEAARATKERPVRIVVAAGNYQLDKTLQLEVADSDVTWEAEKGADVVFSAGRKITGWKKNADGIWEVTLPEVKEGKWDFDQLWVGGRRATRARTPNRGFLHLDGNMAATTFEGVKNAEYEGFTLDEKTFAIIEGIPKAEREEVLLTIPHAWSVGQCRIADLDSKTRSVRIKGSSRYAFLARGPNQRLFIEGFKSAMDEAGEWHLDHESGTLFYMGREGEDLAKLEVVAPVVERFVDIKGAHDVTFRGIRFLHSQYLYPDTGIHDGQAAVIIGGSVEVSDSREIHFDQCEFGHIGSYAVYFESNVSHSSVTNSHLHDLGGGGVRIGNTNRPAEEKLCHHITVDNCIMQHGGRLHPSACGVVLTHATDCAVTHCDIGDFYYSGVSFGWNWGYGESLCRRNRLENCRIHHLGWAYLSDMGAFYNLGNAPETVVSGNHVHHVASYHYGGWGLYNDEGSGDVLMENNLVHDTSGAGFHQHYGYANRIRNNIFAFGQDAQVRRSRVEEHLTITFENNIALWDPSSNLLKGPVSRWNDNRERGKGFPADNVIFRRNLYWQTDGKTPECLTEDTDPEDCLTWKEWQDKKRDRESRFEDPLFENIEARNFKLKAESPALKMGFKPWDYSLSGVRSDGEGGAEWRELAAKIHDMPSWETEAVPWPEPRFRVENLTFENVGVGSLGIKGASGDIKESEAFIGVVEGKNSPIPLSGKSGGTRALQVLDAPEIDPAYYPLLNVRPDWEKGDFLVSFDVMSEPESKWFFEIRGSAAFGDGPYVRWQDGKLAAQVSGGMALADIPAGEWVRIEIRATTGSGKWSLSLVREDGTKSQFADIPCKPEWDDAGYLFWSATGDKKAAFYIDNLNLIEEKQGE
ncbi:right-handed parallel beta-helix repeat-containing protein [Verrucomicrobiales bacterium BCK34]|nr:right-handed parallel beta-helix repeat-containing protein [Verrucomicrobiales bacterium BCK34]